MRLFGRQDTPYRLCFKELMSETSHPSTRPKVTLKKGILISAIVVAVLLAALAVWWFMSNRAPSTDSVGDTQSQETPNVSNVQQLADKQVYGAEKNVDKGLALYDKVIETANDTEKVKLYTDKSLLAANNGDFDAALAAALGAIQADKEQKDYTAHFAAATAYQNLGKKTEAIAQYELALEKYVKVSEAPESATAVYYKKQIAELRK